MPKSRCLLAFAILGSITIVPVTSRPNASICDAVAPSPEKPNVAVCCGQSADRTSTKRNCANVHSSGLESSPVLVSFRRQEVP